MAALADTSALTSVAAENVPEETLTTPVEALMSRPVPPREAASWASLDKAPAPLFITTWLLVPAAILERARFEIVFKIRPGVIMGQRFEVGAEPMISQFDPAFAAFSSEIISGILEKQLGFHGLVMSDSLSAEAVSSIPVGSRAIRFLQDGGDLIVIRPVDMAATMAKAVEARAASHPDFRARLDSAALHVLEAKDVAGLLPC